MLNPNQRTLPDRLLTKKEVAEYLHYSTRTIENYMRKGEIDFYQLNGGPRFDPEDVQLKNQKDTRLADFFCGVAGFMAVPRIKGKRGEAIQAIMTDIAELTKGNLG